MGLGVAGYVLKNEAPETLVRAIGVGLDGGYLVQSKGDRYPGQAGCQIR